jgi:hypothetical protein
LEVARAFLGSEDWLVVLDQLVEEFLLAGEGMGVLPGFVDEVVGEELGDFEGGEAVWEVGGLRPRGEQLNLYMNRISASHHSNATFSGWNSVP